MSDLHSTASSTCDDERQTFMQMGISLKNLINSELEERYVADSFFDLICQIGKSFKMMSTMTMYFVENKNDLRDLTDIMLRMITFHIMKGDFETFSDNVSSDESFA